MHLTVQLGGHTSPWRFGGSSSIEQWLEELPWQREGGVRVLSIQHAELLPRFGEAARTAIYGRDAARTAMRFYVTSAESADQLESEVASRLGIPQRPTEFECLLELARRLEERPAVFVIVVTGSSPAEVVGAADSLVERVDKVGGRVLPTFVMLTNSTDGVRGVPDDFTGGWPIGCAPTRVGPSLNAAWPAYVHERLAWESGGDVQRAEKWDASLRMFNLPHGDDNQLESRLNAAATANFAELPLELRGQLESRLSQDGRCNRISNAFWDPWEKHCLAGIAWRSAGSRTPAPTPWLARALLLRGVQGPTRNLLRSCLICAPLARQILSCCFDLEAHERAVCSADLPPESTVNCDTAENFERFSCNSSHSEAEFYPAASPARPWEAWHFASWGEIIEKARSATGGLRTSARHDLRTLRNALSHGHYVSWKMLHRLRNIQNELGFVAY